MGWLSSGNRKVHQRRINKYVRKMNENIYNDTLWRGRFYVHQRESTFVHEGPFYSELYVLLEYVDRLTGRTWRAADSVNSWCFLNGAKIWEKMNWFIVEYIEVWQESPDPREATYNFRKEGKI